MAEEKNVFIIKDGDDAFNDTVDEETEHIDEDANLTDVQKFLKKYRFHLYFSGALFLLIIIFLLLFSLFSKEEEPKDAAKKAIEKARQEKRLADKAALQKVLKKNDIEKLLTKANMLYSKGEHDKALNIYHQISLFNETLSYFNLGVMRLKEEDYEKAYLAFKKALLNNEHRTASAINAAVCATELNDTIGFNYHIDLASASLESEVNEPLYSYYYTLIHYYKENPFKTLAAVAAPTSEYFIKEQNEIAALTLDLLDDPIKAIEHLEANKDIKNSFALGLLYSNIGEYYLAIDHLKNAEELDKNSTKIKEALLLNYLKSNQFSKASVIVNKEDPDNLWRNYPISVKLKDRLFDVQLTQKFYAQELFLDKEYLYNLIFYYAPYFIYDAHDTITKLRKGQIGISTNELALAKNYLNKNAHLASTNAKTSMAIKLALNSHTAKANKLFIELQKDYSNHETLEYNLGLSYAQLGNYKEAYQHFKRANFLNYNNVLAGVFAIYCADLAAIENPKLYKVLEASLKEYRQEGRAEEVLYYRTLLNLEQDNFHAMVKWINRPKEMQQSKDPLHKLLDTLIADRIDKNELAVIKVDELLHLFPKDLVSNILDLYIQNKTNTMQKFSFNAQEFMQRRSLDFDSLFFGPNIARNLYIKLAQITGNLPKVRLLFKYYLEHEAEDRINLLKGSAEVNILLKKFEIAFNQYNQLIDELNVRDSDTLLKAALAAIGSNHKENAIVLLEIAKRKNRRSFESRYGLGLLYHEVGNLAAAGTQYHLIKDSTYVSKYFDFDIKEIDDTPEVK
jgi:tetratricopeptide (TPR) repeat protein